MSSRARAGVKASGCTTRECRCGLEDFTKTTVKSLGRGFEDGPSGCSVVLGYPETFEVTLCSSDVLVALMTVGLFCLGQCDVCCEKWVVSESVAKQ